ncbi:MAG TPA: hypothetical protein P5021_10455, partial [Candidatus Diapherotrites archaeon]|nr:hypothetical protein [Candidatus Diapherotrites archaeon]
ANIRSDACKRFRMLLFTEVTTEACANTGIESTSLKYLKNNRSAIIINVTAQSSIKRSSSLAFLGSRPAQKTSSNTVPITEAINGIFTMPVPSIMLLKNRSFTVMKIK